MSDGQGALERAGFGDCGACLYVSTATPAFCYECAGDEIRQPPAERRCGLCAQELGVGHECRNLLCRSSDRQFDSVTAVGVFAGTLRNKVLRYKYEGKDAWGVIFGRLLAAHLATTFGDPADVALVTAMPLSPGDDRPHTGFVVERAQAVRPDLAPWDPPGDPTLGLTRPVPRVAGRGIGDRRAKASVMRDALEVRHPERVHGTGVVYDDVFTTGLSLNEVARALRQAGADSVVGVVLGRQPWGAS